MMMSAKRKRNSEDCNDENDASSHKRASTVNPYSTLRPSYHSKSIQESSMPTPHKRSHRGAAHGAPKPGVQQRKKRLPAHQTPTCRLNTASSSHTQASLSTSATSASPATELNPLLRTGLVGTRRQPSFSRAQNGPQKRKCPCAEEANASSRPKKISRPDVTGLSHPKTAPRPRVPRLKNTGLHDTTSYLQHIYKLPAEIALQVFSYMEDKDVTKVRSTSKWIRINMSDRFTKYCTQTLEKKTEFKDKSWELSFTRSSINQLLLICRIPRLAHLITSININFACPSQAGVRLFDKIERAYQNAAAADRKSVLRGFNTLKSLPDDKLFRRFRQEKRLYECDYREHAMDAATGDDLSMLVEVFKELTHVENIWIGGWNKDMRVDYNDLMSAERRNLEESQYTLFRRFNETLARYRSPRLHSIKLSAMKISVEELFEFLKGHKDSLRRLSLRDVTLVGGAWARIWALLKHEVQLENAFFGSLHEDQPLGSIAFPWKSDSEPLSDNRKRALQLGPDDSEFVDDMAIVEREVADGLDKLVRLSVVEPFR